MASRQTVAVRLSFDTGFARLSGGSSCCITLRGGVAGQLSDEGSNATDPELDVDSVGPHINAFDE
jgi:hypothetical protein